MILELYISLQETYKWSISEIDNSDAPFLIDEIVYLNKKQADNKPQMEFIDNFM